MIQKLMKLKKKITDHKHDEYVNIPKFNKLVPDVFNAKLAQINLVTKTYFNNRMTSINRKTVLNKTKNLVIEKELKKLKAFDLSYFRGKNHFDEDSTQNWFIFQPMGRY